MRIAISGTRGIPNRYGGFEIFAERLSMELLKRKHQVWVYNTKGHPWREKEYSGVEIVRRPSPEKTLGSSANLLYDLSCLRNAIHRKADIILECGYASAAPWYPLIRRSAVKIVTHMDGMEWQREKWDWAVRRLFRWAEQLAVKYSDAIVCDHPVIADYYQERYGSRPEMIAYGAELWDRWDEERLGEFALRPGEYYLLVARLEPENNIRQIIEGYLKSSSRFRLVVVGDYSRRYGQSVYRRFGDHDSVLFAGAIYESDLLDTLRHFSGACIHGHSAGGTNPSLLETMAAGAPVIAHDNPYNRWVLAGNAAFFSSPDQLAEIIRNWDKHSPETEARIKSNFERVRKDFQWDRVTDRYETLFEGLMNSRR